MKFVQESLVLWSGTLLVLGSSAIGLGQDTVVACLTRNGELVCTNLEPGSAVTVQWAASMTGPWTNSWEELQDVTVDSNGTISVVVPLYYRVRGIPRNPNPERLVWIPPGTFVMGSPETEFERGENEGPQTEVTISRGFWMGRYEVTQGEWLEVMEENPSYFRGSLNLPVEMVRWIDTTNYCGLLTEQARAAGRLPAGYVYRLPTEAEWEYACRAGSTTAFSYGPALRSGMANFDGRYEYDASATGSLYNGDGMFLNRTVPVGSYEPNAWGLYDMHGNIWEWCYDWWSDNLPGGSVTDPKGPPSGPGRMRRGGYYFGYAWACRSAYRYYGGLAVGHEYLGFRVVLGPE